MNEAPKAPRPPRALHDGCEVDDEADGGVGPDEDGAVDVADVGAAAVDDAVDDVVDDGNEAGGDTRIIMIKCNISNCVVNSSSSNIRNINSAILIRTNTIMRMIVNRWDDVPQHIMLTKTLEVKIRESYMMMRRSRIIKKRRG